MTAYRRAGGPRLPLLLVVASLVAISCAGRATFVAPVGPGVAAPDADAIWKTIATACRGISSYRAAFGLTGQIGDRRIRGLASARLNAALGATGQIGLEATVSGQLVFRLGGAADRADLLLRDQNRVTTARPEEILEALIGVPVGPERLLAVVGGCVTTSEPIQRAARHDGLLEIVTGDATVYLTQTAHGWQARAGRFADIAVAYGPFQQGLPRDIRFQSSARRGQPVTLDLRVQAVQTNVALDPTLFRVTIPEGATPITLDELRAVGPLADDAAPSNRQQD